MSDRTARSDVAAGRAIEVEAVDPRWLRVRWELPDANVRRAAKSLGADFHAARFVLRVQQLGGDRSSPVVRLLSEHPLPDDASQWFVAVPEANGRYRVAVGFAAAASFYAAATSDDVSMPKAADRPPAAGVTLPSEILAEMGGGGVAPRRSEITAELVLTGRTRPGAAVTLESQPIPVDRAGHFTVTQPLQNGRQMIPLELHHGRGSEPEIVVAAIELSLRMLSDEA